MSRYGLKVGGLAGPLGLLVALVAGALPATALGESRATDAFFRFDPDYRLPEADKTPAEYWRGTGLRIQHFYDDLLGHCHDSLRSFRGCLEGLSELAAVGRAGEVLLGAADEPADGHPLMGRVVERLSSGLRLFELKKPPLRDRLEARDLRNRARAAHARATARLFAAQPRVEFLPLFERMRTRALAGPGRDNESWYAAALYNEYLAATDDPHSRLTPTEQETSEFAGHEKRYTGVGITTRARAGRYYIHRIFRGSPAESFGLHRNDEILEIDGRPVAGLDSKQLSQRIGGEAGTPVTIRIRRAGSETAVTIVRGPVVQKNFDSRMVADTGVPIGYIRYGTFMDESGAARLLESIATLEGQGARGLILDLRGNGGGLLSQAIEVSRCFVGRRDVLSILDLELGRRKAYAGLGDAVTKLPLAVLIDAGSASASEVTAGAIQDHRRGWIVGDRSFGKGSVQGIARFPFKTYTGNRGFLDVRDPRAPIRYRKTTQRFYQPSGRSNQILGILPDFAVDPFPRATEADRFELREEDEFDNALPATGQPWVQPRPAEVARVQRCRDTAKADAWYDSLADSDVGLDPPDYRLYAAQDIVGCESQAR